MNKDLKKCIEANKLMKIDATPEMIEKEVRAAEFDLSRASNSFREKDYKWCMVQAYYAMFHAAKGLLLAKDYREKSNYCLIIGLRELYAKTGEIDAEIVDDIELGMHLRHQADYGLDYDEESAGISLDKAERVVNLAKEFLE